MKRVRMPCVSVAAAFSLLAGVHAQSPNRLSLTDVVQAARASRSEIVAARARAEAVAQRPAIAGALEDPVISPSIDHYPSQMMDGAGGRRYDWSIGIQQQVPLSGIRGQRERAARAEAAGADADVERVELDVVLDAQEAFFMLRERRRMAPVLARQLELARQLVAGAAARYAGATGALADVLRAEVEVARVEAARRSLAAETRAAEAMLNVSIGRSAANEIGEIDETPMHIDLPAIETLQAAALANRPELRMGAAQIERASAEVDVMRSMYRPMAMIRAGRGVTMAEGGGYMLMVGVSVPIWRRRLDAGVDEALAMQRMANADLSAMRLMVEGGVAAAHAEVQAAREWLLALETEVIPRARTATDGTLAAYASGQGALVLVVDTSRALWEVEGQLVMAETQASRAWARLERALGTSIVMETPP